MHLDTTVREVTDDFQFLLSIGLLMAINTRVNSYLVIQTTLMELFSIFSN